MRRLASTLLALSVLAGVLVLAGSLAWDRMAPPGAAECLAAQRRGAQDAAALARLAGRIGRPLEMPVIAPLGTGEDDPSAPGVRLVRALTPHERWPVLTGVSATLRPVCDASAEAPGLGDPECWAVEGLALDGVEAR